MNLRRSAEWLAFAASSSVILYAGFAAFFYALGPGLDQCAKTQQEAMSSERGVVAEAMAHWCASVGIPNESRLGLHLSDESGDAVLVYYEPKNNRVAPVLHWLDENQLDVDLGEVTWLTPQVSQRGTVAVTYSYSGPEPSLE
jgi:hypothetical protein